MERKQRTAGFTLFELLVVLAIMGIVSTIGIGAFFNMTGAWRLSTFRMDLGDAADGVLNAIKDDLDHLPSSKLSGQAIQGVDFLNDEAKYQDLVRLEDDRLVIPIVQTGLNGKTERLSVQYRVQRENTPHVLTRGDFAAGPESGGQTIAEGVLSFELAFLKGDTWQPAWSEPYNPDAIRVSVTLQGAYPRVNEQISRSAILPIHVK